MGEKQQGIGSIEAGLKLLRAFQSAGRPLGLKEAAGIAGMLPSNTHRYLVSFIRAEMITQDPQTGLYDLGAFALQLGLSAMARLDSIGTATAALAELRMELDMSVFLSLWTDIGPTMIKWLDGSSPISVNIKPGSRAPLLNSASGRAFLAYRDSAELQPLIKKEIQLRRANGESKFVTQQSVDELIQEVRRSGLGWVHGERVHGVNGLSVPVFDMSGKVDLALSVVGLADTIDVSLDGPIAKIMLEIGQRTSSKLGYGPIPSTAA